MDLLLNYKLYQLLITRRVGKILWSGNYFSFPTSIKRKLTHGLLYNILRRLLHYGIMFHDTWIHHSILGVSVLQTTVLTGSWVLTYWFSFDPLIPLFSFTTQDIFPLFCADVRTCPTSLILLLKFYTGVNVFITYNSVCYSVWKQNLISGLQQNVITSRRRNKIPALVSFHWNISALSFVSRKNHFTCPMTAGL